MRDVVFTGRYLLFALLGYTFGMSENHEKSDHIRYLKKFQVIETSTELPIQGQVKDPEDLYKFVNDLQDEQVPKIVGIYLDDNHLFLGHQIFLGATPETFDTQLLYHYYSLFLAKRFIILVNHPSGDPTPVESDIRLIRALQADSQVLSFKPSFADFIIVGAKTYYSMATNDGTACKCGHQEYFGL